MASGCILGKCKKCGELIWEDNEFIFADNNNIAHFICPDNELFTEAEEQRIIEIIKEVIGK